MKVVYIIVRCIATLSVDHYNSYWLATCVSCALGCSSGRTQQPYRYRKRRTRAMHFPFSTCEKAPLYKPLEWQSVKVVERVRAILDSCELFLMNSFLANEELQLNYFPLWSFRFLGNLLVVFIMFFAELVAVMGTTWVVRACVESRSFKIQYFVTPFVRADQLGTNAGSP